MKKTKYTVFFTDDFDDNYEHMTEERLIEYAKNRLCANEDDRIEFGFNTYNINAEKARQIIEYYGELVKYE